MSEPNRGKSAASSPGSSSWIELPELFEPRDPQTTALIATLQASGLEFRTKNMIVGVDPYYGHVVKLMILFRSDDARDAALTLYKIFFESAGPDEGPSKVCDACGEHVGAEARCPSCGLNRALNLTEDPLALWIEKCLRQN
jgi:hypothetical protein